MIGKRSSPVRREATRKRTRNAGHLAAWPTLPTYVRDVTFDEDHSQVRAGHAPETSPPCGTWPSTPPRPRHGERFSSRRGSPLSPWCDDSAPMSWTGRTSNPSMRAANRPRANRPRANRPRANRPLALVHETAPARPERGSRPCRLGDGRFKGARKPLGEQARRECNAGASHEVR
jgi:hypothetical protein